MNLDFKAYSIRYAIKFENKMYKNNCKNTH